ncbi:VacB/RNase II family 3'-5' exoribonuclease [Salicola sp. Rm-C-2C1-2]|uniref:VacB/RNase II family 3'-5' exoribonuclease n=1 Tax=Salicola sp. Rm-C-2C1-2 TaxID=3141321 RepID=UPI0032E4391F
MLNPDALNQLKQLRTDIQSDKALFAGTIKRVTGRFGFVTLDDGRDIYLPKDEAQKVLLGDRVQIQITEGNDGKQAGELETVDERVLDSFVGQYVVRGKGHFVAPDINGLSRWFFVPPKQRNDAKHGDFVHARVTRHPFSSGNAQAEVLSVIGNESDPGIERGYAVAKYQLRDEWPETVNEEVATLSETAIEQATTGREDLTDLPFVTIDAPSTQDMDDAVMAQALPGGGWRLCIAIADPAALLPEDGATEQEARLRASSAYFPGQPRAMLPSAISQDLGSLMAGKDRLALVCDLRLDAQGNMGDYQLQAATIRSHAKLAYESVAALFEGRTDEEIQALNDTTLESLNQLKSVGETLRQWRETNALVNEERPDYRIRLDENRKIRSIEKRYQTSAHRLIEECMIAANRCAADFLQQRSGDGLFITHAGVRDEKADNIRQLLEQHCPELLDLDPTTAEGFTSLVRRASALETDLPVKAIVMRQLERAEMATEAAPHQGMGLALYTTMTSPLRKYSDYFVHRLIRYHLGLASKPEWDDAVLKALQESQWQLRQAVNEMENSLKCQFAPSLGEEPLEGSIVQVNAGGFQVKLDDTGLVGFVAARDLPEKFSFDPVTHTITSDQRRFRLDQPVTVRFKEVDEERRQIRFNLVDA